VSSPREHLVTLAGTAGALAVRVGDVETEAQRQAEQICAKMEGHKSAGGIRRGVSGLSTSCSALALALSTLKSAIDVYVSERFQAVSPVAPGLSLSGGMLSWQTEDGARVYGIPGYLRPPLEHHQVDLEAAIRSDGVAGQFPTLHGTSWLGKMNDGGYKRDGRAENCLDCSLSFIATWYGTPTVCAPRYEGHWDHATDKPVIYGGEEMGTMRAQNYLRQDFGYEGKGWNGVRRVVEKVRALPHGAAAVIITAHKDEAGSPSHAWNIVNDRGVVRLVDPQCGWSVKATDVDPTWFDARYSGVVFAIVLRPEWKDAQRNQGQHRHRRRLRRRLQ
jgi:hypothetical protein